MPVEQKTLSQGMKYSASRGEEKPVHRKVDEKVKANLFGLGGNKDVSSEMFAKEASPQVRPTEEKLGKTQVGTATNATTGVNFTGAEVKPFSQ